VLESRVPAEDAGSDVDRELFALLMGLREPAIAGVYVQGREAVVPR
jgi:guanine deaminase